MLDFILPYIATLTTNKTYVAFYQNIVNDLGFTPPLTADGVYGPKTAASLTWLVDLVHKKLGV